MLGSYATITKVAIKSRVESHDPWVENLAVSTMADVESMLSWALRLRECFKLL